MKQDHDSSVFDAEAKDTGQPSVEGLIARLEAATEGSPELDLEIAMMLHGDWLRANCEWTDEGWVHRQYGKVDIEARQFTRSIDDAVSLVPEGWFWRVGRTSSFQAWAAVHQTHPDHGEPGRNEFFWNRRYDQPPSTPSLALCIPALRARHAVPQTGFGDEPQAQNTDKSKNNTGGTTSDGGEG